MSSIYLNCYTLSSNMSRTTRGRGKVRGYRHANTTRPCNGYPPPPPPNTTLLYIGKTGVYMGSFNQFFRVVSFLHSNFSVMSGRNHRFPGYYQYFFFFFFLGGGVNVSGSRTQHGDLSEDRIPDLSLRSPTLYHKATAPP